MLPSFIMESQILRDTPPHDFQIEQGHSVLPHKVWREAFHGRCGKNYFGQIYWGTVLHGGLMIRSW